MKLTASVMLSIAFYPYTRIVCITILMALGSACSEAPVDEEDPPPYEDLAIRAVDLSFLPEIEAEGTAYFDSDGTAIDLPVFLREQGWNTVRLRLWKRPATAHSGLAEVTAMAERVRAAGMKVWLDLHYSDTWADPGHQTMPNDWITLSFDDLNDSLYAYTAGVLDRIDPDYVQIGNEINGGILWEEGRITDVPQFSALLSSGIRAARDHDADLPVMIHFAGHAAAEWFYELLFDQGIDYDIIALSYYPVWHGKDLDALRSSLSKLSDRFSKPIVFAEVAYPFTLGWNDYTNNIVGLDNQLVSGFAATPTGQKDYLASLAVTMLNTSGGMGLCYWAPDWVAFRGPTASDGSTWENQALFNFELKALPAAQIFAP
jgi:arabinogalactan endo-1,4-beta-galactosidase